MADPTTAAWKKFKAEYQRLLVARFEENRTSFEQLAALAADNDVFIGCSCPTAKIPDADCRHTVLALGFMKQRYPNLKVLYPQGIENVDAPPSTRAQLSAAMGTSHRTTLSAQVLTETNPIERV